MTATIEEPQIQTSKLTRLESLIPKRDIEHLYNWRATLRLATLLGESELLDQCEKLLQSGRSDEFDIEAALDRMVYDFIDRSEAALGHAQERHVGGPELIIDRYRKYKQKCGKYREVQAKQLSCFTSSEDIATVVKSMVLKDWQFTALQNQLAKGYQAELGKYTNYGSVACDIPPLQGYSYKFTPETDLDNNMNIQTETFHKAAIVLRKDRNGKVYLLTCYPQK